MFLKLNSIYRTISLKQQLAMHTPFFTFTLSRLEDKRNNAINAVLLIKDTKLQLFPNHAMSLNIFEG